MPEDNMMESVEAALAQPGKGLGASGTGEVSSQPTIMTNPTQSDPMKDAMGRVRATLNGLSNGTRQRPGVIGGNTVTDIFRRIRSGGQKTQPSDAAPPATRPPVPSQSPAPTTPSVPAEPPQFTVARSAIGKVQTSGYDYGGMRVEMPEGFDMNNPEAVRAQMDFSNTMADWINEDEED